jgi:hypothetical protein
MSKKTNSKANPNPTTIPPVLTGVAGEYFVAAELSRRGHIASISLRNTRGIDILATNQAATRSITIQCKTNKRGAKAWMLNQKSEDFFAPDHYYVFVALGAANERPSFHVVPSERVLPSLLQTLTSSGFGHLAEMADYTWIVLCGTLQTTRIAT